MLAITIYAIILCLFYFEIVKYNKLLKMRVGQNNPWEVLLFPSGLNTPLAMRYFGQPSDLEWLISCSCHLCSNPSAQYSTSLQACQGSETTGPEELETDRSQKATSSRSINKPHQTKPDIFIQYQSVPSDTGVMYTTQPGKHKTQSLETRGGRYI